MKEYLTVKGVFENTAIIERSKFICYLKGIDSEEEAKDFILEIKKKNSLATHNCYAYIADEKGLVQKFSDDGEPQGTAGLPMLEILKSKGIYKTVAVVTRYFGGIKLGTGGLTKAYGGAVVDCLDNATVVRLKQSVFFEGTLTYEDYSKLLKIKFSDFAITETLFDENVNIKIAVVNDSVENFYKNFSDAFLGKISLKETGKGFYNF